MSDSSDRKPIDYGQRRSADRRSDQRALLPAILLSIAFHAAVLLFISFRVDYELASPPPHVVTPAEPVMKAYDIAAVDAEVAAIDVQVREREVLREAAEPDRPWTVPQAAPAQAEPAAGADRVPHDRLEYRMGSTEIWRPQAPLPREEVSPDERVRARVAAQLQEYNDSVANENAMRAKGLDWTIKDGNGNKWGVSPGTIHLGSIEKKFNIELPRSEELAARERTWTEIQLQAGRVETQMQFDERVRAIRERTEQERAKRNSGGSSTAGPSGGSSTTAPPGGSSTTAPPGGTSGGAGGD